MKEEWRPVPWKEFGRYQVSSLGNVTSSGRFTLKFLKPIVTQYGYCRATLYSSKTKKPKSVFIHRLVLEAFVGPKPKGLICCHKNGVRADNKLSNLRYGTYKENAQDAMSHGTFVHGQKSGVSKLTEADVFYILDNYKRESYVKSNARELAKKFGVTRITIVNIASGRQWVRHYKAHRTLKELADFRGSK